MLLEFLQLSQVRSDSIRPRDESHRSLLTFLESTSSRSEFSAHALAALRIRFAMMLLPNLPESSSYNGRKKITSRYLVKLGLRFGEDYDEDDIEQLLAISDNIRRAGEKKNKDSWSDLHYLQKKTLLEAQNHRCKLCGRRLQLGSDSSSMAQPALDHIIPFDLGGNKNNVRLICRGCNTVKGQNMAYVNSDRVALNYFIKANSENEVRLWVFERDQSTCTEDGCSNDSSTNELRVVRVNELGREIYDNLRTVCDPCSELNWR